MSKNTKSKRNAEAEVTEEVTMEPVVEAVKNDTVENVPEVMEQVEETPMEPVVEEPVTEPEPVKAPEFVEPAVKEVKPVKNSINATPVKGKINVLVVDHGSPLQIAKVVRKLNQLGLSFELDESNSTIITNTFDSMDLAISCKKYLCGKGFKPVIKEV